MNSLYKELRSEANIFAAWRHVKKSALSSSVDKIRGEASQFEHKHQTHLRRYARQLRAGSFEFDAAYGVLKDKKQREAKGKAPRPLEIGSLKNRIVQRAILQVLQPREIREDTNPDSRFITATDPRLGRLNEVNRSKYGVGGLIAPYGGVRPAIETITNAINSGSKYYFRSDIQSFFTAIPIAPVVDYIRAETKDDMLADIFHAGLSVQLENSQELGRYAKLFPSDGIGVAQGSSLSALAGNVLLFELDHRLNSFNVTAIRYIDDLLIVSPDKDELEKAKLLAHSELKELGLSIYEPAEGSDKAAEGKCSEALEFLGCMIQYNRCVPSKASISSFKKSVANVLSELKSSIKRYLESGRYLAPDKSYGSTLQKIGRKVFGWQRSLSFATEKQPFVELDHYIMKQIENYDQSVKRMLRGATEKQKMVVRGIPSMEDLFGG